MAKSPSGHVRGDSKDRPLTHEERRRVIEAPWPVVGVYAPKRWGGTPKRESLIPDGGSRSWSGHGDTEGDATDD
jgi:hypothetical protein